MQITVFEIDVVDNEIDLTVIDASNAVSITVWTESTYRDTATGIDLSGKLTGAATENITITPSDLSQSEFDGVYFIEVVDDTEIASEITSQLVRYEECLIERAVTSTECSDCLNEKNIDFINSHAILTNLKVAINLKFTDEILNLISTLKKYCKNDCKNCGKYSNVAQS